MNDGFDPLFALRSYDCEKSRQARDKWLAFRLAQGMPVIPMQGKHEAMPREFAKQFQAMRNKSL